MSKNQELIEKLREVRSILLSTTLGLTEEKLSCDRVTEKWAIKDILGHVASWQEEFSKVINKFLTEDNPQYTYLIKEENNWREWNLAEREKKKDLSYERTLQELFAIHERFIKILEGLKDEDFSVRKRGSWGSQTTIEQIILSEIEHELEHGNQILEWRKVNHR